MFSRTAGPVATVLVWPVAKHRVCHVMAPVTMQQEVPMRSIQRLGLSLTAVFLLCGSSVGGSTQPPSALSYATGTAVYTNGVLVTANIPTSTGGAVTSYSCLLYTSDAADE